jgi:DEAD/DEAH box helicase domain-containing protein
VKACYQCLYAYREGQDLPVLDRARAREILGEILDAFQSLTRVETIGTMSQSAVLESELEVRFVRYLEVRVKENDGTWERLDEGSWRLSIRGRRWLMRAQVNLGADRVAVACRADFVLYPEDQSPTVRPVAVFTDGLAFHVMPGEKRSRLADDSEKRHGISSGGEMLSWSLSWKDVVSPESPVIPKWVGDGTPFTTLQSLAHKLDGTHPEKLSPLLRVLDADPLRGLVAYLEAPARFPVLAELVAATLLNGGKRQPYEAMTTAHAKLRSAPDAPDVALLTSEGETPTASLRLGEHTRLLIDGDLKKLRLDGNATGLRVTLRLDDSVSARDQATFEASWRLWLRAWNVLQTVPDAVWTTRSATERGGTLDTVPPEATAVPRAKSIAPTLANPGSATALAATLDEVADERARGVLEQLYARHPHLEAPRVPFELRPPTYPVSDDVEIGFMERRVAAFFDHQSAPADVLATFGWKTFSIERGLTVEALEQALGLDRED